MDWIVGGEEANLTISRRIAKVEVPL
jgi:hypothetical protein